MNCLCSQNNGKFYTAAVTRHIQTHTHKHTNLMAIFPQVILGQRVAPLII